MSDRLLAVLLALFLVLPLGLSLDGELFGPDDGVSPGAELESLLNRPDAQRVVVISPASVAGPEAAAAPPAPGGPGVAGMPGHEARPSGLIIPRS